MKLLVTVGVVELSRQYQRQDGSWQQIYVVPLSAGDNTFAAETFRTPDSQAKAGIVRGAVGYADLEFRGRAWSDKNGVKHFQQNVTLRGFELANRNLNGQGGEEDASGEQAAGPNQPAEQPEGKEAQVVAEDGDLAF